MKLHGVQFTIGQLMIAVAVIAFLLASLDVPAAFALVDLGLVAIIPAFEVVETFLASRVRVTAQYYASIAIRALVFRDTDLPRATAVIGTIHHPRHFASA